VKVGQGKDLTVWVSVGIRNCVPLLTYLAKNSFTTTTSIQHYFHLSRLGDPTLRTLR